MNELTISGELLQKLRLLKNVKQEIIAKALGVTQPRYCQIEKKEVISGELLERLMEILGYTATELGEVRKMFPLLG